MEIILNYVGGTGWASEGSEIFILRDSDNKCSCVFVSDNENDLTQSIS